MVGYILTEEEYKSLAPKEAVEKRDETITEMRKKILKLAKFKCVHDRQERDEGDCDDCPVGGPKTNWSLTGRLMCNLEKYYSK